MNRLQKYYALLGISPTTDLNQIKKAYRKKALAVHPDRNPSPDAQSEFIALTEAYEILTGQQLAPKTAKPVKTAEEIRAEKIKQAKKRYREMQQKEELRDMAYYHKITSGMHWKVFKFMAIYTFLFTILLSADFFLTRTQRGTHHTTSYSQLPDAIAYKDDIFLVHNRAYWRQREFPVLLNYSFFFNDLKSVSVLSEPVPPVADTPPSERMRRYDLLDQYATEEFSAYASVYYLFPYFHIFLVIPILLVFFKRPNFRFSLFRVVCIWAIFPITIYLSLFHGRIFHLFGL